MAGKERDRERDGERERAAVRLKCESQQGVSSSGLSSVARDSASMRRACVCVLLC